MVIGQKSNSNFFPKHPLISTQFGKQLSENDNPFDSMSCSNSVLNYWTVEKLIEQWKIWQFESHHLLSNIQRYFNDKLRLIPIKR